MNSSNLKIANGIAELTKVTTQEEVYELAAFAKEKQIEKYVAITNSGVRYAVIDGTVAPLEANDYGISYPIKEEDIQKSTQSKEETESTSQVNKIDYLMSELANEIAKLSANDCCAELEMLQAENTILKNKIKEIQKSVQL